VKISQGLGRALDISKGGMLLETPDPIPSAKLSLMAVDKDNILFEIEAELVYCKKSAPGFYQSGIRFIGTEEQVISYVTRLIKEYNSRKKTLP
jgi:c-di-GMP-binding flagellar brake protein YcgR